MPRPARPQTTDVQQQYLPRAKSGKVYASAGRAGRPGARAK